MQLSKIFYLHFCDFNINFMVFDFTWTIKNSYLRIRWSTYYDFKFWTKERIIIKLILL